jgi:hypothetical protein
MSDNETIRTTRALLERQQEKLRIARQALARVEAKYARKQHVKHPMHSRPKMPA